MNNPWARPYCCTRCRDTRRLVDSAARRKTIPCPNCGRTDHSVTTEQEDEQYQTWKRKRIGELSAVPELTYEELDAEQKSRFAAIRNEHPHVAHATIMSWIEGGTYDPSRDEEFMAQCQKELSKWRFELGRIDDEVAV